MKSVRVRVFSAIGLLAVLFLLSACFSPGETTSSQEAPVRVSAPVIMDLEGMQNSFRQVAQSVLPAVVRIDVVEVRNVQTPQGEGTMPFWEFFFGQNDGEREFRSEGLGSGVIVRRDGNRHFVLTNAHVIGDAQEITVRLDDGRDYTASLVGRDIRQDLALVEFSSRERDIAVAVLGDSDSLQVGDWVLAMGSPLGFQSTVTAGIVSALGRSGGPDDNISDFIQTDASINRGNSGGALVNIYGEVVGINTWISSQTGGNIGLGFSIPVNNVKRAIDDFIADGQVQYGWLGVQIVSIVEEIAESLSLQDLNGALVTSVYQTSPAGRGGILPGDFIIGINDKKITSSDELVREVGRLVAGDQAKFELLRNGEERELTLRITSREAESVIAGQSRDLFPGFSVYPLTREVREQLDDSGSMSGVIVRVITPRTPGAVSGIAVGDVITEINGESVSDLRSFYAALADSDRRLEFRTVRSGEEVTRTIVK